MKDIDSIIDTIKKGDDFSFRHENPYIKEALLYPDILFTKKELLENNHIQKNQQNLILEIGCYFGKTVIELAINNPKLSILGIDITYKRAVKTARKIKNYQLKNAYVSLCDGLFLCQNILKPKSLSGVCIFFPDPWSKAREEKNRLINSDFVKVIFNIIKSGGFFWLKTDKQNYFLNSKFLLEETGFILSKDFIPNSLNNSDYETEFQKMFTQKQVPFYQGVFLKP